MLPIASAISGNIITPFSAVGGRDYNGVIVDSVLNKIDNVPRTVTNASIAIATEFVFGVQPTISSILSIIQPNVNNKLQVIMIDRLITLKFSKPLSVIIEPDDDAYIVRCPDLPVFGFANDPLEAIASLKREIESLYFELMADDNFSPQWLDYKEFLRDNICELK
ncbi:hypothetical protein KD27_02535 [Smithella sp. D17]|jgi:predicted RNase H-like HicB family nuclease|nr:hypothetical protein KD27_02535 [Smithella sp. D17]